MKTAGIIAEYNPFHKGHKLHIEKTKALTGAERVVVVMSGDFTQRGECAILDKYIRAEAALRNGADLVLELPAVYALSSAEGFARGGVSILTKLRCVDYLSFGSECGSIGPLLNAARILEGNDPSFDERLRSFLKEGLSYPKAAFEALDPKDKEEGGIFSSPNNILAIEYLRAILSLKSDLTPVTVKREDNGYANETPDPSMSFASARSIRKLMLSGEGTFEKYLCENTFSLFKNRPYSDIDDYSPLLYHKLLSGKEDGFTQYADVSEELSFAILKNLKDFTTFREFILLLKSKNNTYARIARALFHILLDMKKEDLPETDNIRYVRVLGFRKDSSDLLSEIKKSPEIELISKPADAPSDPYLQKDIDCALLYTQVNGGHENEYRRSPVIV